jgi:hypothetical protein
MERQTSPVRKAEPNSIACTELLYRTVTWTVRDPGRPFQVFKFLQFTPSILRLVLPAETQVHRTAKDSTALRANNFLYKVPWHKIGLVISFCKHPIQLES